MKKKYSNILICIIFLIGLSLVLYPFVSDFINDLKQSDVITIYENTINELSEEDYSNQLDAARDYNKYISQFSNISTVLNLESKYEGEQYENILNLGSMGYLDIPLIDVKLPIFHGTEETVLQDGVGHYRGSSFPVGGNSTHCVLTGHTGLPSSRLLTDIDQLSEGDVFYIHVLNETLAYEVDQIKVVLPNEIDDISIVRGEDYCTLVTCTPYGINTHRLLVRGKRISYVDLSSEFENELQILPVFIVIFIGVMVYMLLSLIISKLRKKG